MTLADEATNSIQTDNAKMTIQGNVAMQVTQLTNSTNFGTNASKQASKQTNMISN